MNLHPYKNGVFKVKITDKMVQQFADLSGDRNPIHLDEAFAAKTIFKKRIAHGMILPALISRFLGDQFGTGGIYISQNMKFKKPVFIDDEIEVFLNVKTFSKTRGLLIVETNIKNSEGELVLTGEAILMVSDAVKAKLS